MKAEDITSLLARYQIIGTSEAMVQERIEKALDKEGVEHRREVELAPGDRIDFMVGTVGVEVKTKGTRSQIIRQLGRYVRSDEVKEIVLAATSRRLLAGTPDEITGMPIVKHLLQGAHL